MGDAEWTKWALQSGFSGIQVVGNILRWENYKSLFSLLQIGKGGKVWCYDSGKGLCCGQYSYGARVETVKDAPTWDQLFTSYGVSGWARAVIHKTGLNMDGEERMCDELGSEARKLLGGQDVRVVTAASPCNKTCADLLSKLVEAGRPKSFTVRYFRAYTNQEETEYLESLETLGKAGILCLPIDPGGVDHNVWRGVKDAQKVVEWMQKYNKMTEDLQGLSQQILTYFRG